MEGDDRTPALSPCLSCLPACFFLLWATDNNKNIAMIINIIQFLMSADKAEDIACKWKYARRSDSFAGLDASLPGMPVAVSAVHRLVLSPLAAALSAS